MKNLLLFLSLPIFFLASCDPNNKGQWVITDVSKDTLLIAETNVRHPSTLILEISGQVNDTIEVHGMKLPGGKIQREFRFDHYYPKVSVQFKPYKATKGRLKIKYHLPSALSF